VVVEVLLEIELVEVELVVTDFVLQHLFQVVLLMQL
tara:strand:- start:595 stop:702 length:108 start_codon:yes stop_codon:yes gene_type:complete